MKNFQVIFVMMSHPIKMIELTREIIVKEEINVEIDLLQETEINHHKVKAED